MLHTGLFFCLFVLPEYPPSYSWLSPIAMLRSSRAFSIIYPLRLFASGIFSACGKRKSCEPNCNVTAKYILCLQCGLHVFLGWEDSTRCLVDSWDSTVQPYTDVGVFSDANLRLCHHLRGAIRSPFARHGWCHKSFQFSPCVFENSWVFSVTWINEVNPLSLRALSSFGFSFAHSCFSPFWAALPIFVHTSGNTWSCLVVDWIFVSLTLDHISFWKFFFQKSKFRETFPRIWQASVRIDIPKNVNLLFLQHVQISMSRPFYVNVFQWNRECFFLRHAELNSRFIVKTIDDVTLDRPEVGTGFSVILSADWDAPDSPWRSLLKSSLLTVGSRLGVDSGNS